MVRGFADCLWRCSRIGCGATGARPDPSIPALRIPGRHRSSRNDGGKRREERSAMSFDPSRSRFRMAAAGIVFLLAVAACNNLPGRPRPGPEVIRPEELVDFTTLYNQNCSGCHGADGKGGAAIGLGNPVYLAIADDATIRRTTAKGVRGTQMPPFAQTEGGMLSDIQINALVRGIRSWARP